MLGDLFTDMTLISSFDLIKATDFCIEPKFLIRFYFILSVIPFTQCLFLSEREHLKSTLSRTGHQF